MISVLLCTEARKITINQMQMEERGKRGNKLNEWIEIEAEPGFSSIQLVTVIAIVSFTKII